MSRLLLLVGLTVVGTTSVQAQMPPGFMQRMAEVSNKANSAKASYKMLRDYYLANKGDFTAAQQMCADSIIQQADVVLDQLIDTHREAVVAANAGNYAMSLTLLDAVEGLADALLALLTALSMCLGVPIPLPPV